MNKQNVHDVLEEIWEEAKSNPDKTFDEWYYFIKCREQSILKKLSK